MICKQTPAVRPPGFTLLEVMIAVAIMSMALVAAIGSQSQSVSLATEAKFSTTATFLAQSKMADLEAKAPDDLFSDAGDFGEDFPGYRWESEVSDATLEEFSEASKHLKKIVLTVGQSENDKYRYRLEYYRFVPEKD
ncbi:MAG: prepilin-type N-terminal cleavage/methylation domain-containing protein [Deltaproteobacteria bacterium]|nr:prepilin-type N-terminal cleavage/methylation domain-containing protein [Deltaproteobacteria bacterium]MBW2266408.1 prepilin-type N-terminal cleavage/methylation domain-containing protein [Deltaproteobacteria bacterium]MBW2318707.1 prepilin-type N-terminal cleavage/methylation domain-containing protein [Deltaproteobacteria bacterium]